MRAFVEHDVPMVVVYSAATDSSGVGLLGKKRHNSKHARAWVSEIIGWQPASTDTTVLGLKGDALNLNTKDVVTSNPDDRTKWDVGKAEKVDGGTRAR